jgi:hypothetical protein
MNPLPRPHRKHRLVAFVLNFGFFAARAFTDVFAIDFVNKKAFSSWGYTTNKAEKSQRKSPGSHTMWKPRANSG